MKQRMFEFSNTNPSKECSICITQINILMIKYPIKQHQQYNKKMIEQQQQHQQQHQQQQQQQHHQHQHQHQQQQQQ